MLIIGTKTHFPHPVSVPIQNTTSWFKYDFMKINSDIFDKFFNVRQK